MRAAHWYFALFLISILVLAGIRFPYAGPTGAEDPAHPDRGVLSPLLGAPPRRIPVARVEAGLGRVIDIASRGQDVAVLGRDGWILRSGDSTITWWRDRTPGAPDWLSRPQSIALGAGAVYVLDSEGSVVSEWDDSGKWIRDLPLPFGSTYAQRPSQLLVGPAGRPLVTVQRVERDGTAFWEIFRFDTSGTAEKVLSLPSRSRSMVFREPLLAVAGSTLLSLAPLTHALSRVDLDSPTALPLATRSHPPLWRIPRRHRREYQRMLAGMGAEAARLSELPDFWPSVRDFTVRSDGSILVAVTAGEDRQHLEILTGKMAPMGRFSSDGFVEPIFLSQGRAFVVEEALEGTVIHELLPDVG